MNSANAEGLHGFIRDTAMETPTAGLSLLGRLIPVNMAGALDLQLTVRHVDETAPEMSPQSDVKPGHEPEAKSPCTPPSSELPGDV